MYPPHPFTTMPQPGQSYVIIDEQSGTALDLSGTDHMSVVCYNLYGGANQKVRPTGRPSIPEPRSLRVGV